MAETPPPFQIPPPAAKATSSANKACLIIVLMVLLLCAILAVIFAVFIKGFWTQLSSTGGCVATFEMTQESMMAYADEHNGKLPNAKTWQDDIKPYYDRLYKKMAEEVKDVEMLRGFLPPAPDSPLQCDNDGQVTGVAFNSEMSGKKLSDVKSPTTTVTLFESDQTGHNLAMPYKELPKSKAPKLMNEKRDWIIYYVEGNKDPFDSSSSSNTSIKISREDALTPKKDKATGEDNPEGKK